MPVSSRGYFVMANEAQLTAVNGEIGANTQRTSTKNHPAAGTTVPYYWAYPAEEIEFVAGKEFIDFQEIRGSRQAYQTLDGPFRPTAMIKGAVYPGAALGQFLYGALGDVKMVKQDNAYPISANTTTNPPTYTYDSDSDEETFITYAGQTVPDPDNAKAYEMVFFDGATLPNFHLERSDGRNGSATIVEQMASSKVESLQFTANFGEKVEMTANFQGAKRPNRLATSSALNADKIIYPGRELATPIDPSPLYFNKAAIYVDGSPFSSGYMKTVTFELRNTITRQEVLKSYAADPTKPWALSETVDSYKLFEGGMECTLSGTAVFENTDLYDKVLNGATLALELYLASDTIVDANASGTADDIPYMLYFFWPKVKVSRASVPFRAGEVIESDVEFKVIYDPNARLKTLGGANIAGIEGGAMFAKLVSHHPGDSSGRPSFYSA